jgi:predicted Zn-dependent protease
MERMATKTLAEIYLQQGHLQEAYEIFKALSEKDPSNQETQARLKELEEKLRSSAPIHQTSVSTEEKIRILKQWLANIQERRKP